MRPGRFTLVAAAVTAALLTTAAAFDDPVASASSVERAPASVTPAAAPRCGDVADPSPPPGQPDTVAFCDRGYVQVVAHCADGSTHLGPVRRTVSSYHCGRAHRGARSASHRWWPTAP